MNQTVAEWYRERAEAFIAETVGLHSSNVEAFRKALITVTGHTIVITSPYLTVRDVAERWASDGGPPPPEPYDSIRTQALSKKTEAKK